MILILTLDKFEDGATKEDVANCLEAAAKGFREGGLAWKPTYNGYHTVKANGVQIGSFRVKEF